MEQGLHCKLFYVQSSLEQLANKHAMSLYVVEGCLRASYRFAYPTVVFAYAAVIEPVKLTRCLRVAALSVPPQELIMRSVFYAAATVRAKETWMTVSERAVDKECSCSAIGIWPTTLPPAFEFPPQQNKTRLLLHANLATCLRTWNFIDPF